MKASRASPELVLKVLLVGAPKAGKTSLVRRMCDKAFREDYVQTLGFDVTVVPYGTYQGRPVKLHLWDVAGSQLTAQPCHHGLIGQGAEGVLYVMDVTSRESLQAVDDWDQALSKFYPPWTCKLLVGHKADLPAYVVNDEALSLYVAGASGFRGWCLTVGSSEYGDYDVAARRGGGSGATAHGARHKGQSLSGEKQLSVSEAVRTLLGHVFRSGGAARGASRPAGVLGLGASAGRATPLPSDHLQDALETVELLGLGGRGTPPVQDENGKDGDTEESSRGRECADWPEEERSGDGPKGRPVEMRSEGLRPLLERGRGPDPSWRQGVPGDGYMAVAIVGDGDANGGDPGWRHFAGRMGREEAEALLSGRPDGTFFLRRKGPSLLVLTYVASAKRSNSNATTPTSGARNQKSYPASRSPRMRNMLGSPQGEKLGKGGLSLEGVRDGLAGSTLVQHALLVHEGGFFSDEKGRLGRFSTLEELLKSKISAIARHPLSFRRERDGYVLIDEDDPSALSHEPAPSTASTDLSPSTNPFARADKAASAHDRIIRGNPASSLAPTANGNLFGPGSSRLGAAAVDAGSSPPSSPLVSSLSPCAGNAGAENPFDKALRRRRPNTTAGSGSTTAVSRRVTGDWTDSRVPSRGKPNARRGGSVANSGAGSSSAGGSLWMEAATAAVEHSGPAAVVAAPSIIVTGVSNVSGRPHGDSLSSDGGTAVVSGSLRGTGGGGPLLDSRGSATAGQGGSMKWAGSAVDDAGARGSMSSPSSIFSDVRGPSFHQQQHQSRMKRSGSGRRDTTSAMAEAAEAAAVMAAARGHPDVRRVEERTRSAQAGVDRAAAVLEQRLRPLVARKTPMHSPLQRSPRHSQTSSPSSTDFRGSRRTSPPTSSFSSSRDVSPRSLDLSSAPFLGREPPQRWVAAAPEGSATAPLAATAALLMERACACRQELAVSSHELNERAVALAVAETTSAAAASLAAATSDRTRGVGTHGGSGGGLSASESSAVAVGPSNEGSGSPLSPSRSFLRADSRQRFLMPAGVVGGNGNRNGNEISMGGVQGNAPLTTLSAPLQGRQTAVGGTEVAVTTAAPARPDGGLAGMSCCVDFERILGYEEADTAGPGGRSPFVGDRDREAAAAASSAFRVDAYPDRGRRLSDSSMVAERSFSGSNQLSGGSVAGGLAPREPRDQGNLLRIMVGTGASALGVDADEWGTVFRDLEIAEERGREFVNVWEAAGGALKDACDDLAFEEDGGRGLAGGLLSQ